MFTKIFVVLVDLTLGIYLMTEYHKAVDKDLSDLILGVLLLSFAVSSTSIMVNKITEED